MEAEGRQATKAAKAVLTELQPTQDRVLVQWIKEEHKTTGGLYLPETTEHELGKLEKGLTNAPILRGLVLAVGPGKKHCDCCGVFHPTEVKPGDKVLFNGRWNDLDGLMPNAEGFKLGKDQALITEGDIVAILN